MTLEEALQRLLAKHGPEVLRDSFRCKCLLSDDIAGDRYQRKILLLFLLVNEEFDLYASFKEKGLEATRAALKPLFPKYKPQWQWEEFRDAINALAAVVCPKELGKARQEKAQAPAPKKPAHQKGESIVVGKKPKGEPAQTPAPTPKKQKAPATLSSLSVKFGAAVFHLHQRQWPEPFVLKDGNKEIPLQPPLAKIRGGKLSLDLSSFPRRLDLYCSVKHLHKVQISGVDSNIELHDGIDAEEYDLRCENGSIVGEIRGNTARVETQFGFMDLASDVENLFLSSHYGEIKIDATHNTRAYQVVVADLDMGSLDLKVGQKLSPRPTKLLGRTRDVDGTFTSGGKRRYRLKLHTQFGGIRIH
ncbi:MAG: hypothetical protein K6E59_01265 [Bacilli bacterium]|nr:hypothetical protein [Bacilli bacterium]